MNKKLRIIVDIVLIAVGIVFLIFGIKDAIAMYKNNKVTDNVQFSKTYRSISEDNIYKYVTDKEANKILNDGTGVVLIGKETDAWMQVLVAPLNDYAESYVDTIYYLEMDKDTESYKVSDNLDYVKSPTIIIVKNGKVLDTLEKDDLIEDDYKGAPIDYFDSERLEDLHKKLTKISNLK